jgi:hypothetical protein
MTSAASTTAIARSTTAGRIQRGENPEVASSTGATTPIFAVESATGTGLAERIVILPNPSTQNSFTRTAVLSVKIAVKTRRRKN